ncbi:MAG: universal stress protein [Bacteroidota bacterium]
MTAFKRILVGLDLSSMDPNLLQYLALFNQSAPQAETCFLHVSYAQQLPVMAGGRYTRELPDQKLIASIHERLKEAMKLAVHESLPESLKNGEFTVLAGTITREMLAYANKQQVDLTILGRKKIQAGSGLAATRFLRNAHCSVLFVPENPPKALNHIMVATDFSDYSVLGVRKAIELAKSLPEAPQITLVHVFDVPTDMAYKISRTQGQYAKIIRENVESVMADYLQQFDWQGLAIETELIENTHYNAARHLNEFILSHQADLMVMGAHGHSSLSAWLLGSLSEKMLKYNEDIPLLIVRGDA